MMEAISRQLTKTPQLEELLQSLDARKTIPVSGLWGASYALVSSCLLEQAHHPILLITTSSEEADRAFLDYRFFLSESTSISIFPEWESIPSEQFPVHLDILSQRLLALRNLLDASPQSLSFPSIFIASIQALQEPVINKAILENCFLDFQVHEELPLETAATWLVESDFERLPQVEAPGEFSIRGGILDVFSLGADYPVRIEYFGDEVDSIRQFDPSTQRSIDSLQSIQILAAKKSLFYNLKSKDYAVPFLDYLPNETWYFLKEPADIQRKAKHLLQGEIAKKELYDFPSLQKCWREKPTLHLTEMPDSRRKNNVSFTVRSTERFSGEKDRLIEEITTLLTPNDRLVIVCPTQGEMERLEEILKKSHLANVNKIDICLGTISRGFELDEIRVAFVGCQELFCRSSNQIRHSPRRSKSVPLDDWIDLNPGDYVVHVVHGIGRYLGMERFEKNGEMQEFLAIEFADACKIYVPITHIDLVQKYIGPTRTLPQLSKVGSLRWRKKKQDVKEAVEDLAQELLRIQALREASPGVTFPKDDSWQIEFENAFPFEATEDQVAASECIKHDLEQKKPMDRLLCGDVGYGKTEVAMRAAFKAVMFGKQVALLCPTTVLAQQHFRTFSERMREYPITIEVISRFKSKQQLKETLGQVKVGAIDILIGTHRLVQKDVEFPDLGLLIIDEEQRFGVKQKEYLKWMRRNIEVLTMTATPIPRTLHMSLLGIKDISALNTPPHERQNIHSEVCRFDPRLIRDAILREMNRQGQIYFVHNRVYDITQVAARLSELVPEAKMVIAHGKLLGDELEARMKDFIDGIYDILICTTIIGSGVDIPNVNTIFIHDADIYGLAELHQLRGRVGRYKHRAFAYFLLPEERPISTKALRRLKAVEEFSELGAGFKIAMRDLEIRGAGNILGAKQSGQIGAVGYELYCKLLDITVRQLKNEPISIPIDVQVEMGFEAFLPNDYVPSNRAKLQIYRQLTRCHDLVHLKENEEALKDRFGALPESAIHLLLQHEFRILAQPWEITLIRRRPDRIEFHCLNANHVSKDLQVGRQYVRQINNRCVQLLFPERVHTLKDICNFLKEVLGTKKADIEEGATVIPSALIESIRPLRG